jgi:pyroglutamyl-peptidase
MMKEFRQYLEVNPLPKNITVESITIYEVAQKPALETFTSLAAQQLSALSNTEKSDERHVFVHFGVHSSASIILLEQCAWNEMSFRVCDQRGFQPNQELICPADGTISHSRTSSLPLTSIKDDLCSRFSLNGKPLFGLSTDPGRFLCNYLYYVSLLETSKYPGAQSLFVHVPPFEAIPHATQMHVIHALLNEVCQASCN